jgi:hypothetical protein
VKTARSRASGKRKSWTDKLDATRPHEVKPAPMDFAGMKKGEVMLIPSPRLIEAFIRAIPIGSFIDIRQLRRELARQNGAEVTCPITTGFHLRIVAEAAFEARERGAPLETITPIWRVLDEASPSSKKLCFGLDFLRHRRREEALPSPARRENEVAP